MRILFTIDSLANAGTENSMAEIMQHFPSETTKKVVYFYNEHRLLSKYEQAGAQMVFLNLKGKWNLFKGTRLLIKQIKSYEPQIVVASLYRSSIMSRLACWVTRTPLVDTFVCDTYGNERIAEMEQTRFFWKFKLTWFFDKFTAPLCKHWIANSKSVAASNAKALNISDDNIQVIYRGRNTTQFPERTLTAPIQFNAQQPFVLVGIGRLIKSKGFVELLEAMALLVKKYPFLQLHLYGDGALRNTLQVHTNHLGLQQQVIFHGNTVQPWLHLYQAHCFVFPSWYEGFSGALIEAMLTGVPIVASDISMNQEAVQHNVSARLFNVQQVDHLAEQVEWVLQHYETACALGKTARTIAMEQYAIQHIVQQYFNTLQAIVHNNK